jgi:hypothetical protein
LFNELVKAQFSNSKSFEMAGDPNGTMFNVLIGLMYEVYPERVGGVWNSSVNEWVATQKE